MLVRVKSFTVHTACMKTTKHTVAHMWDLVCPFLLHFDNDTKQSKQSIQYRNHSILHSWTVSRVRHRNWYVPSHYILVMTLNNQNSVYLIIPRRLTWRGKNSHQVCKTEGAGYFFLCEDCIAWVKKNNEPCDLDGSYRNVNKWKHYFLLQKTHVHSLWWEFSILPRQISIFMN